MFRHCLAGCLALLLFATSATAQQEAQERAPQPQVQEEQNPTLVVSQWKCDWREMENLVESTRNVLVPVWDQLVADGLLMSAGVFVHAWGDEWNYNIYRIAPDLETFFRAIEAEGSAAAARVGELGIDPEAPAPVQEHCTEHKDNIYTMGPTTGMQGEAQP